MKYFFITLFFSIFLFSNETININFKELKIEELIKITSKYLNKNILYSEDLNINVTLVSNSNIKKKQLYNILKNSLEDNGYLLIDEDNILRVVKKESFYKNRELSYIKIRNIDVSNLTLLLKKVVDNKEFFSNSLKPIISIEKQSNSILIAGVQKDIDILKEFIKKIDIPKNQIYIKAKIIEISETKTNQLGIEYGLKGFNKFSSTTLSSFSSSLNSLSNSAINLSEFSAYGFDISSLSKAISLNATINFLKQNEAVDVISEPSILCINNKKSSIYVGETKSFKTGQTTNQTGTTESFKREDIGLRLEVKPRISKNRVIVEINTILEDAKESTTTDNLDTSKKEVKTTVILNNAESVVIGGLIKSKNFQVESKVPLLGDIPIFGSLFKNEKHINDKINLIVVITPYIIEKNSSLTLIKSEVDKIGALENIYMNNILKNLEKIKKDKKQELRKKHEEIVKEYLKQKY